MSNTEQQLNLIDEVRSQLETKIKSTISVIIEEAVEQKKANEKYSFYETTLDLAGRKIIMRMKHDGKMIYLRVRDFVVANSNRDSWNRPPQDRYLISQFSSSSAKDLIETVKILKAVATLLNISLDFTEISLLTTQLTEKIDANVITIDDIVSMIEKRDMNRLQTFYNEDLQKKQVFRMFNYYDKGWKNTTPRIVYKNTDKIAVVSVGGVNNSEYYGTSVYNSAWVLGISEAQLWIHKLVFNTNFNDKNYVWTEEFVRRLMNFDEDISETTVFEKNKAVRIQGDLTITQVETYEHWIMNHEKDKVFEEKEKFDHEFKDKVLTDFADEIHATFREYFDDYQTVDLIMDKEGKRSKSDNEELRQLKKKYELEQKQVIRTLRKEISRKLKPYGEPKFTSYIIENDVIGREVSKQDLVEKRINHINKMFSFEQIEKRVLEAKSTTRQQNIRQGNHLIIVEKAYVNPRFFWSRRRIVVLDANTNLLAIHDEHMNSKVVLPKGVYEIGLLQRHRSDMR